ncbi:MAG TPA: uracil-DNA glycosylase [Bacillota bacterium]
MASGRGTSGGKGQAKGGWLGQVAPEPNPHQVSFEFAPGRTPAGPASDEVAVAIEPELPGQTALPWGAPAGPPAFPRGPARASFPGSVVGTAFPAPAPHPPNPYDSVGDLSALAGLAADCRKCGLRPDCRGVVFGEGHPRARVLVVGEGPGAVEDELGRPFVGPAGKLLDKILTSVGFTREEVYITNVVKCRPPGNRVPLPDERAACRPWLEAQIRLIAPKFLVCLGASAAQSLIDPDARITKIRGVWFERLGLRVMPTYHPAALLRDETKKRPVWEDFKALRAEHDRVLGAEGPSGGATEEV